MAVIKGKEAEHMEARKYFGYKTKLKPMILETYKKIEKKVLQELDLLIKKVEDKGYDLVLVTNEVGSSIVPEHHISRVFRDIQGKVNQRIAALSDEVYLLCSGIAVKIK